MPEAPVTSRAAGRFLTASTHLLSDASAFVNAGRHDIADADARLDTATPRRPSDAAPGRRRRHAHACSARGYDAHVPDAGVDAMHFDASFASGELLRHRRAIAAGTRLLALARPRRLKAAPRRARHEMASTSTSADGAADATTYSAYGASPAFAYRSASAAAARRERRAGLLHAFSPRGHRAAADAAPPASFAARSTSADAAGILARARPHDASAMAAASAARFAGGKRWLCG